MKCFQIKHTNRNGLLIEKVSSKLNYGNEAKSLLFKRGKKRQIEVKRNSLNSLITKRLFRFVHNATDCIVTDAPYVFHVHAYRKHVLFNTEIHNYYPQTCFNYSYGERVRQHTLYLSPGMRQFLLTHRVYWPCAHPSK